MLCQIPRSGTNDGPSGSEGRPGVFSATVNILPGTHHIRFLVDGLMQTSRDIPTTVDFGNNLVNYIEVNPDDLPGDICGAAAKAKENQPKLESATDSQIDEAATLPRTKSVVPVSEFRYDMPRYLADFDQPEESPVYQSAVIAIDKLPTPPSLPGFLGKPILNAAVLLKDDNSVLNMPNHTVLNHLATSSIKNNTLAVSATTRYKNKVGHLAEVVSKTATPSLTRLRST
jgi:5'-AMP-activated protein kinase beta subunit-like protein/AMP-activated protein kinase-like protein